MAMEIKKSMWNKVKVKSMTSVEMGDSDLCGTFTQQEFDELV